VSPESNPSTLESGDSLTLPATPVFQPRNPDYRAVVESYVVAQDYLRLIGVELARLAPGGVDYRVPFRADLGQQNGFFHGGVVGGVAEAVMGAAAFTLVEAGHNIVGAEYKLNLLSPGLGSALLARGTVVKSGRTLIVCRADVFVETADGEMRLCAIAQGAMAVVKA
jgi:uncharacterized protein (TIGR00369 family)